MPAIMADVHCEGHFHELLYVLLNDEWSEIWVALGFDVETFESLGLPRTAPDPLLWQTCQEKRADF